jgi:trehalose 6-phosphate phosphatase
MSTTAPVLPEAIRAVIFDMDGVITDTASFHAAAWKRLFDDYLRERANRIGEPFVPFDEDDYRRFVDGMPRFAGVRTFLASRAIEVPEGDPADPPDRETVSGLGNRKNELWLEHLRRYGADPYPSTVTLVRELRVRGVGTAVVSASRNMSEVLDAAGLVGLFAVRVDGALAEQLGLPGKPDPAIFVEAARRLGEEPARAAVIEDALAGVEAGARGGFGFVVGVDRTGHADALRAAGADIVVSDLAELQLPPERRNVRDLPDALDREDELRRFLSGRRLALFLDYDGTLTPIVERPEDALLPDGTRGAIERLAALMPVAIVSGRDLADVRNLVGADRIAYGGSHGFDLVLPDGSVQQRGTEFLRDLEAATDQLAQRLEAFPAARIERKAFGVAVHVRQVSDDLVPVVDAVMDDVAAAHPGLRRTGGKKVFELRPNVEWNKGRALQWLLEELRLGSDALPIYVGDDETDEDAFRVVRQRGLGIVVRGEGDDRPTQAGYALRDTDEVRLFLELLIDLGSTRRQT